MRVHSLALSCALLTGVAMAQTTCDRRDYKPVAGITAEQNGEGVTFT